MKRVAIGGFLHESNTFLPVPTTYEHFRSTGYTAGPELLRRWTGAHHEIGGMIAGAAEAGLDLVPLIATYAVPSGTLTSEAFERICEELLSSLRAALPLDGVLLALHGATVSAEHPDADGEVLARVRALVGDKVPIVVTFDLHANVSPRMIGLSTAAVAYRSNPHLDQAERGREAAGLMARILRGEIRPVQALETPPLIIAISGQHTATAPARGLYDDLAHVLTWPGILSASVCMGFYYSDVAEMGASFWAVADGDTELAHRAARWMADRAWQRRAEFATTLPSPSEAVRLAAEAVETPVVLMDIGDNVGGGSPADSTVLLAEIMRQNVPNGLVVLYDPEGVQACLAAGPGAEVSLAVGGRSGPLHGEPVAIRGRVRVLSDGRFVETQVRHGGWGACDQGITAQIETEQGHAIVLTSRRMAPMSLEQVLSLGIKPERYRVIVVKGVVAPRAAYQPIAARIVLTDTPGVTADNPRHFTYHHRRVPMFPLEPEADYR
jgi:microcystin degradation protein MlrC